MAIAVGVFLLILLALVFFIIGHHFRRGKWLRLIAGNTLASEDSLKSPFQIAIGKRLGITMYIGGMALAVQGVDLVVRACFPEYALMLVCDVALCASYACLTISIVWVFWKSYSPRQK